MVTKEQLVKLQEYAKTKDTRIKVSMTEWGSIEIKYAGDHFISMANKSSSFLSMKRVKAQIDVCAERHKHEPTKKVLTPEERKERNREAHRKWLAKNPDYIKNYQATHREQINASARKYQATRREKQRDWMNKYHQTKEGRATNLLNSYIQMDLEQERGVPKLTRDDIMRKCFSDDSKCVYCGATDWRVLGLDRINNDLPHHASNCICACHDCNVGRYRRPLYEYIGIKGLSWDEWMTKNNLKWAEPTLKISYAE